MNLPILYQWTQTLGKIFVTLGRWQVLTLSLFSYGVILAQSCQLSQVAKKLNNRAENSALERRLQRWLANERVQLQPLLVYWVQWVAQVWGKAPMLLVVDETKLSDHVAVMMLGVSYDATVIPLVWRAYHTYDYPEEGQVRLLHALLTLLHNALPADQITLLLADRGLGTSPEWQQRLETQQWPYLVRVQRSTRILLNGKSQPMRHLAQYGGIWTKRVQVFKKAGWQWKWVYIVWLHGYREPLCLTSNQVVPDPLLYTQRFYHECSFRDLKSDGFHWQRSRVWLPAHAERLLLVLACATLWVLTKGTQVEHLFPLTRRQQRFSLFRLGLDYLFEMFHTPKPICLEYFLTPDPPILKSVVP